MDSDDFSKYVHRDELLQALKNRTGRTDLQLLDGIEIERATSGVEGFLSMVLRVKASYLLHGDETRHSAVLIAKAMPKQGLQRDIVKATNVFSREGAFFEKIVPLLKKVSNGKVDIPLPTCYHAVYGGDNDVLYMEDLTASGHSTPDRSYRAKGLDFEHCYQAMKNYGKLHAITVTAEKLLPSDKRTWIEAFPELSMDPMFSRKDSGESPYFKSMLEEGVRTVLMIAKNMDGLPKEAEASGKLSYELSKTWDEMIKRVKPSDKGLNVLSHGDCWMNNLMFQYEAVGDGGKKPVDVKFIDLQAARYCHPCMDLICFLFFGTRKALRSSHLESLISTYYESFVETLEVLACGPPPFTLKEVRDDFHGDYKLMGYFYEAYFGPILLLEEDFAPSDAKEMTPEKYEEFISSGNSSAIHKRYKTDPNFRSSVEVMVRDLVDVIFPNGLDSTESTTLS